MNKPEKAYSASDTEIIALVLAVMYFRCYLFGRKFPHVDALSSHVSTVLHGGNMCPQGFLQEQGKDKSCQSLKLGNYSDGHEFFFVMTRVSYTEADPMINNYLYCRV